MRFAHAGLIREDHRVDDEEGVVRLDLLGDLADLLHHLGVDREATGGVDDEHVLAEAAGLGETSAQAALAETAVKKVVFVGSVPTGKRLMAQMNTLDLVVVLLLLIFAAGWLVLRRRDWFFRPGVRGYVLMLVTGLVIAVSIELVAVYVMGRWEYTKQMPLVPGLGVGLTPVAQMLVLPPIIFHVVTVWLERAKTRGAERDI